MVVSGEVGLKMVNKVYFEALKPLAILTEKCVCNKNVAIRFQR
jgi:hypothetical protein